MMEQLNDLQKLQSLIKNIIKVGVVSSVNPDNCTVKVAFKEFGAGVVSGDLPVMVPHTKEDKDYDLPVIDEQVLCLFLGTGLETGFCLGSFYSDEDKPVNNNPNIRQTKYKDGTVIQYDRENHKLTAMVVGDIEVQCVNALVIADTKITAAAPAIEVTGEVKINGNLMVDGTISASENINDGTGSMAAMRSAYNGHGHPDNGAGAPTTPME